MSKNIGEGTLQERIEALVVHRSERDKSEYTTVTFAAKALKVKPTEVRDNLPEGFTLDLPKSGSLGTAKIVLDERKEVMVTETMSEEEVVVHGGEVEADVGQYVQGVEKPEPEDRDICIVCGQKARPDSTFIRGVCPLCFREMAAISELTQAKIVELSDEDFSAMVGKELGRRKELEDYKASRFLTKEEFEARKDSMVPVKTVFEAAKDKGIAKSAVAKAVGGDKFRHEPLGGFGSIWTPYFYGARGAWWFDADILSHIEELRKPEKPKKEKKSAGPRKRGGGKEMKVVEVDGEPVTEDDVLFEDADLEEELEEGEEEVVA